MKILLLSFVLLIAKNIFSQGNLNNLSRLQELKRNTVGRRYFEKLVIPENITQQQKNRDMPVLVLENKGAFQNNNGKGEDIYVMKTDNMRCVVPDSTFKSNMPGSEFFKKPGFTIHP